MGTAIDWGLRHLKERSPPYGEAGFAAREWRWPVFHTARTRVISPCCQFADPAQRAVRFAWSGCPVTFSILGHALSLGRLHIPCGSLALPCITGCDRIRGLVCYDELLVLLVTVMLTTERAEVTNTRRSPYSPQLRLLYSKPCEPNMHFSLEHFGKVTIIRPERKNTSSTNQLPQHLMTP